MNRSIQVLSIAAIFTFASNIQGVEQKSKSPPPKTPTLPIFQPKNLGAPKIRVGGGSRGSNPTDVVINVLAPEQTGFTTRNQPTLYWSISKPVNLPIEITITDKVSVLLKTAVNKVAQAGIQTLNLADHNVHLIPDTKYKWSVAIVNNPKQRSADTFASAGIMLVNETQELKNKLASIDKNEQAIIYAGEGIWYDALAAIQSMSDKTPGNKMPEIMRASLLQQVGISNLN